MDLARLLAETTDLARAAAEVAVRERQTLQVEKKPDGSLVTNADRATEEWLRPRLEALIPGSSVWGEELGRDGTPDGPLWIVDPVDGTSNFAFGSPLWGVSVGLVDRADLLLGVVVLPDLGEVFAAAKAHGVTRNGEPLASIRPGPIEPYELVSYSESIWHAYPGQRIPGKMRCSGAIVVDGTFVACGRFRGMIGMRERLYDFGPIVLMGLELGAEFRYADGRPVATADLLSGEPFRDAWVLFPRDSGFYLPRRSG
ncbi:MAG: inositol monophosphatase family protein [Fimbriimonadales bacterium]